MWSRTQGLPGVGAWDPRPHGYGPSPLPSAFQGVGHACDVAGVVCRRIGSQPHNLGLNVMNKNYLYFLAFEMIARIENLEVVADHEAEAGTHEHDLLPDFHFR